MKIEKLLGILLTLMILFTSNSMIFAEEKTSSILNQTNWMNGLENDGKTEAIIIINGFFVYEDWMENGSWFYKDDQGVIFTPLASPAEMADYEIVKKTPEQVILEKEKDQYIFSSEKKCIPKMEKNYPYNKKSNQR